MREEGEVVVNSIAAVAVRIYPQVRE